MRVDIDTNVLISYLLAVESVPGQAVGVVMLEHMPLLSIETLEELSEVTAREKFSAYLANERREAFIQILSEVAEFVDISRTVDACTDKKDNKFLDVAVNGYADCIITGDRALLSLTPFEDIPILLPKAFLDTFINRA